MLSYLLYGIFILSCLALVISVLLQPGKADAGQLFTSSVSSTAFGPRGTQTILAKITIGAAITFMVVALLLTMGVGGGDGSLMKGVTANPAATPTPAAPAASPAASPAAPAEGSAAPAPQTEGSPAQGASAPAPATTPAPAAPQQK